MRFETFAALTAIRDRWQYDFGKIFQILLAISFDNRRAGYSVQNHFSEGVDLEIRNGAKYAIEVKTTEGPSVSLAEKDISGLTVKSSDGFTPAVAALALRLSADWVIANATRLHSADFNTWRLSLDSIPDLEAIAKHHFEITVMEFRDSVLSPPTGSPLGYLADVLAKESK